MPWLLRKAWPSSSSFVLLALLPEIQSARPLSPRPRSLSAKIEDLLACQDVSAAQAAPLMHNDVKLAPSRARPHRDWFLGSGGALLAATSVHHVARFPPRYPMGNRLGSWLRWNIVRRGERGKLTRVRWR
ncbi:hypothetical protein HCEG_00679 [Histoplasma capsulatum var. duboisii H88]|uniref:Secreted protein n=1 Tax=Ajellomyces capsulatus (strain H88) TaxID=544711 RepID=F0U5G9_AJEC8|nr:hypothetical protein HCEG_00679 [Histoplasma capsulatum var. duboisii H88]QSS52267.1 hypothetical protein I7I53_07845 [Histoplasma capsulatum var. duboisii H88]